MSIISPRSAGTLFLILGLVLGLAATNTATAGELAKEQVVVLGQKAGDIATVDPYGGIALQDLPVKLHIYGSLVRQPTGCVTSPTFEPDVAEKWEISPDKLTWTFHLRKGVQWHWGYGELTSEDVVYSLKRVKTSKASAFTGTYANCKDFKAVDKYTVQIITHKPDPFLLTKVANFYGGYLVCKKALEEAKAFDRGMRPDKKEAIGTGPFMFQEYKPKDRVVLVRNDKYWRGKPIVEKIVLRYVADAGARELAFLKGEIATLNGLHDQKWLKHITSKGMILTPVGPPDLKALYLNLKMKPFNDKRVRQALAYGIGQQALIDMQGKAISNWCTSPIPSGMPGHIDAGWGKYKRDPAKAKKLLAEAGYPKGFKLKLTMSKGSWYLDKMVLYQSLLQEVGIDLDMTIVDHTAYLKKIRSGTNPLAIYGTTQPVATYWLRNFYHSKSIVGTPTGMQNFMHYANPEVDKLIELAETSFDEKARLDALAKAQKIIVEDLPAVPVVETLVPCLRNPWLDLGYKPISGFNWTLPVGLKTKVLKH